MLKPWYWRSISARMCKTPTISSSQKSASALQWHVSNVVNGSRMTPLFGLGQGDQRAPASADVDNEQGWLSPAYRIDWKVCHPWWKFRDRMDCCWIMNMQKMKWSFSSAACPTGHSSPLYERLPPKTWRFQPYAGCYCGDQIQPDPLIQQ